MPTNGGDAAAADVKKEGEGKKSTIWDFIKIQDTTALQTHEIPLQW